MPRKIAWTLNDGFVLGGFSYHDGAIVELAYRTVDSSAPNESKILTLKIKNAAGEIVDVRFERLKLLNIVEFWPSPIVLDIEINREKREEPTNPPKDGFWNILMPVTEHCNLSMRSDEIRRALELYRNDFFVRLFCSYGCSLALICENIDVEM